MKKGFVFGLLYCTLFFSTLALGILAIEHWNLQGWPWILVMLLTTSPIFVIFVHAALALRGRRNGIMLGYLAFMPAGYVLWWLLGLPPTFTQLPVWWSVVIAVSIFSATFYLCDRYVTRRRERDS